MKCNFLFLISLCALLLVSCEKKEELTSFDPLTDSIYVYAEQVYLWNSYLPNNKTLNQKNITNQDEERVQECLFRIASYAIDPVSNFSFELENNSSVPRYTYYVKEDNSSNNVRANQEQIFTLANDFGVVFCTNSENDIRVLYVINNSPAYKAGMRRGMKVISINGRLSESNDEYFKFMKEALNQNTLNITTSRDNQIYSISLHKNNYIPNPILEHQIIKTKDSNVGYISYIRFSNHYTHNKELETIFSNFNYNNVTKLIVDLRYNRGGYITSLDLIANLIIPERFSGKVMRKELYNKMMQDKQAVILKSQTIGENGKTLYDHDYSLNANTISFHKKAGIANLESIVFIVSEETASASELLINIIKPYIQTTVVGVSLDYNEKVSTYGKPVGSIGIRLFQYYIYYAMFYNLNCDNKGYYFSGIPSDVSTEDNISYDWGDVNDPTLKIALGGDPKYKIGAELRLSNKRKMVINPSTDPYIQINEISK